MLFFNKINTTEMNNDTLFQLYITLCYIFHEYTKLLFLTNTTLI